MEYKIYICIRIVMPAEKRSPFVAYVLSDLKFYYQL